MTTVAENIWGNNIAKYINHSEALVRKKINNRCQFVAVIKFEINMRKKQMCMIKNVIIILKIYLEKK